MCQSYKFKAEFKKIESKMAPRSPSYEPTFKFGLYFFTVLTSLNYFKVVVERVPEYSTRTRLFLGHPNPIFPGRVDTRLYLNPTFSDFWVNFMQIFGYLKELPDFFGTRIRLSLLFRRPYPNLTFYYPNYSIPDFLLPATPLS